MITDWMADSTVFRYFVIVMFGYGIGTVLALVYLWARRRL